MNIPSPSTRAANARASLRTPALGSLLAGALLLAGCTESSITVADADLAEPEETTAALTDSSNTARDVFYADDDAVTLAVSFDVNFVAVYKSFYAWWYFPNGRIYLREPVRNKFGTHLALETALPIRGEPPASWPGVWRVQLTLRDRTLVERTFEIRAGPRPTGTGDGDGTSAAVAGAPAPRPPEASVPLCPDAGSPPGLCNWEAPAEGASGQPHPETLPAVAATAAPRETSGSPGASSTASTTAAAAPGAPGQPVPAMVSPRSAPSAPAIPQAVIEAAERARVERDRAALAARAPPAPATAPGDAPQAGTVDDVARPQEDAGSEPLCPDRSAPTGACRDEALEEGAYWSGWAAPDPAGAAATPPPGARPPTPPDGPARASEE